MEVLQRAHPRSVLHMLLSLLPGCFALLPCPSDPSPFLTQSEHHPLGKLSMILLFSKAEVVGTLPSNLAQTFDKHLHALLPSLASSSVSLAALGPSGEQGLRHSTTHRAERLLHERCIINVS